MVNHWFGGKEALFSEALQLPMNPAEVMAEIVPGDPERLGERIVQRFLTIWDQTGGGPMAAVLRSIASVPATMRPPSAIRASSRDDLSEITPASHCRRRVRPSLAA